MCADSIQKPPTIWLFASAVAVLTLLSGLVSAPVRAASAEAGSTPAAVAADDKEPESDFGGVALGKYVVRTYYPVESQKSVVSFTLYATVKDQDAAELERLPGAAAVKVFMGSSTGSLLIEDDEGVRAVLKAISRRAAFHSEDEYRLRERMDLCVEGDPRSHPVWRDATAALMCTERLIRLARETGKRVHVLHVTTKDEAAFLAQHKDVATAEATPAHLTLAAPDCYERLGTLAQLNPPIRDASHREGIWHGLAQGVIDSIGSDHSPHTREEKAHPYPKTHSGMPGVQTLVPVMLDHVNAGRLSLQRFVDLTSSGPARVFGIACKGRIAVGYDADLTVVDLKRRETITDDWIASRAGWTPFRGVTVTGWPVGTLVRGHRVMWEGGLVNPSHGERMRFLETLAP